ncbi:Centromere protein V [Balamuthia mandrillaris]
MSSSPEEGANKKELQRHTGGCHCGKVRFSFLAPAEIEAEECNCSICSKKGFIELIVPASRFTLEEGSRAALSTYTFGTHTAQHHFCSTCGIASFYVPRSNPDGFSINLRCVDPGNASHLPFWSFFFVDALFLRAGTIRSMKVVPFDGQNWEEHAAALAYKSKEEEEQK